MGFFDSIGNFFSRVGRGIVSGVKKVGDFISTGARKVGDFVSRYAPKIGDIAGTIRKGADFIGGLGIPVISTGARLVGRGAGIVENLAGKAGKVKEVADIAGGVGDALSRVGNNPSMENIRGAVDTGRQAFDRFRAMRR